MNNTNIINIILATMIAIMISVIVILAEPISDTNKNDIQIVEVPVYRYYTIKVREGIEYSYSPTERELMASIVHAEAGNQDSIGKRLVVDVILNRVDNTSFPNTVKEVVCQDNQFADIDKMIYTADDLRAVDAELNKRLDYDVMYFRTEKFHDFGKPAYQHGDHFFSTDI